MSSGKPLSDGPKSVSAMIERLKQKDPHAAAEIWQRFFQRLLPLAHARARSMCDHSVDGEDILVAVFERFFRSASVGRFAKLHDRDDLWQILMMLTERELIKEYRRSKTKKRNDKAVFKLSDLAGSEGDYIELADHDPSPEFVVSFNDQLAHALAGIVDAKTRDVALMKLEGYENTEIAEQLQLSLSTVERKLRMIREAWEVWFVR